MNSEQRYLYKKVGNNIKVAREEAGLTQDELSKVVGLSRTSITNIEQGKQAVSLIAIYKIVQETGTKVKHLLPKENEIGFDLEDRMNELRIYDNGVRVSLSEADKAIIRIFIDTHFK